MKTTVLFSACALSAIFVAGLLAEQSAAQQTQREKKEFHSPEMDGLIKAIHVELKELKKTHPWLAAYDDKKLYDGKQTYGGFSIMYMPEGGGYVKHPSQFFIVYLPLDGGEKSEEGENDNLVENISACRFPALKAKVYASILVRGDTKTAEAIRKCIIKQCEMLQLRLSVMNELIKSIHVGLIELGKTEPWLAAYNNRHFGDHEINFTGPGPAASYSQWQQPPHLVITFHPIPKFSDTLNNVPASSFPALKMKIYAEIVTYGYAKDEKAIRNCIIKQCEAMQEKLKMRLQVPNP